MKGKTVAVVISAAATAFAAGWWASSVVLAPPVAVEQAPAPAFATVTEAKVGRALAATARAERAEVLLAQNSLVGVVTAVTGGETAQGGVLFWVAGVPVRGIVGSVPFYRDLSSGSIGEDVAQLQRALADLGHFTGAADGRFGSSTSSAVKAWQRDLGQPATGVVVLGELVAVPVLPTELRVDDGIQRGVILRGGENAVWAIETETAFVVRLAQEQAALVPNDATVTIRYNDLIWNALITSREADDDGTVVLALAGPEGAACADQCDQLPAQPVTMLSASIAVEQPATGPAVPAIAVRTDEAGRAYVLDASGARRDIEIVGASGGLVVVSGLDAGDQVALPSPEE